MTDPRPAPYPADTRAKGWRYSAGIFLDAARVAPEKAVFRPALPMFLLPGWNGTNMGTRLAISKKTRFEVFKRDRFTCQYCGAHPPDAVLHVDHIVPVAEDGPSDMDNYVTACMPCNLGKGARSLEAVPQSLAEKAAEVAEREEQLMGWHAVMSDRRERIEDDMWEVAEILEPGSMEKGMLRDSLQSIKKFNEKLGKFSVMEAAEIALAKGFYSTKKTFRYFCGICWNRIREIEEKANA